MIIEVRTYQLKPGSVAEVEKRFGEDFRHGKNYRSWQRSGTPKWVR